jgi:hypothetical protein
MEVAARVLARLARVERLDRSGAPAHALLAELAALAIEAEAWAREEGGERALEAACELRRRTEGMSRAGPNR